MSDTIAAIATATGAAGIGIVRVSGPEAFSLAEALLGRRVSEQPTHTLRRATLRDPQTQEPIDDGLLAVFRAPRSFTGENSIEFQGHGGTITLSRVLTAFLTAGARLARPGEFSERAFLYGKLDLTQAEALADLIAARSVAAQRAARRNLSGALSDAANTIAEDVREALARLEATIDFPEDVGELDPPTVDAPLARAEIALARLLLGAGYGRRLAEGITVALTGAPNVGKSSLLNALAGAERAIVTEIPGTTRDVLAEELVLAGIPARVLDTAGLRETDDPIEKIGVARARAAVETADIVLVVVDAKNPQPIASFASVSTRALFVVNKADLADPEPAVASLHNAYAEASILVVSAKTGQGLAELAQSIAARVTGGVALDASEPLITRARHEDAVRRAAKSVIDARQTLAAGLPAELIAVDAHGAMQALGELTGETTRDDVIAGIFARFCIGK